MIADTTSLLEAAFAEALALEDDIAGATCGNLLHAVATLASARIIKTTSFGCRSA